jgi:hypothetical protein
MKLAVLDLVAEAPLRSLEGLANATENYAWCGYDAEQNVGFFSHLGRWSWDRELWREQLYIYLPDRTVLAYRGFGRGDCSTGPAAGIQQQRCLEPGKRWSLRHHGPIMHLDPHQLVQGPAQEPFIQRVEFDIEFHGDLAPFFYPQSDNTIWGAWHYEQVGSMSGVIKFEDNTYNVNGFAFRDHTRGPRNLSHFCGSNWIQGLLPGGTGFAVFQTWQNDSNVITTGLSELTLTTADSVEEAKLLHAPGMDSMDDLTAPIKIAFESSHGRVDIIGEPLNTMIFSPSSRHEILLGAARGKAPLVVAEQPVLLRIGDQISVGHSERCRLLTGSTPLLNLR